MKKKTTGYILIALVFLAMLMTLSLISSAEIIPVNEKYESKCEPGIGWIFCKAGEIWENWFKDKVIETSKDDPTEKPIIVPEVHEKELPLVYADKYQAIKTTYVDFELPKQATHYWSDSKGENDLFEVIVKNFSIEGKSNILRLTWTAPRYAEDTINIDYNFINGQLNASGVTPRSSTAKATTKFNNFKIETGTLAGYNKTLSMNSSCMQEISNQELILSVQYDLDKKAQDERRLDAESKGEIFEEKPVTYDYVRPEDKVCEVKILTPYYTWETYKPITTTIKSSFTAIDDINVTACGSLSSPNTVYTLNQTLTTTGTCLTIDAVNITLDCKNNWIYYGNVSSVATYYGIYNNGYNMNITNCNVKRGTLALTTQSRYATWFNNIPILYINNSNLSYNTIGLLCSNTLCIADNLTITNTTERGFFATGMSNSKFTNIDVSGAVQRGVWLGTLSSIYVENITARNCGQTSSTYSCIELDRTNNGVFKNINVNGTLTNANAIKLIVSSASFDTSNNTFINVVITNPSGWGVWLQDSGRNVLNNTFINATYTLAKENVVGAQAQLIKQWYYQAYVNDTLGNPKIVNLTADNVASIQQFNTTTNSSGYTGIFNLTDYVNSAGSRSVYSLYNITISNITLTDSYPYNLSLYQNNLHNMVLMGTDHYPPVLTIRSPTTQQNTSITDFNVSSNENLSWCGLSLDSATNISMPSTNLTYFNYTNNSMIDGQHTFTISCNDTSGNMVTVTGTSFLSDFSSISVCRTLNRQIAYTIINNLTQTSASVCLTLATSNITIDGQGYTLKGNAIGTNGFYSLSSRTNITINNASVINFTGGALNMGIVRSNFSNLILSSNGVGMTLTPATNSSMNNINVIDCINGNGFTLTTLVNSNLTNLYFNNISFSGRGALSISGSSNNTFKNITGINCGGINGYCIALSGIASNANGNLFENISLNGSLGNGIYITVGFSGPNGNARDNLFKDIIIENTSLQNVYILNSGLGSGLNNTFLNATYTTEGIAGSSNMQIIRQWYYQAYVKDLMGNSIDNANVSVVDNGAYSFPLNDFNLTTNASGYTIKKPVVDYVNQIIGITYLSPYTNNASKSLYTSDIETWNVTLQKNNIQNFTLINPTANINVIFTPTSPQTYPTPINASCITNGDGAVSLYREGVDVTSEEDLEIPMSAGSYDYSCNITNGTIYLESSDLETFLLNKATPTLTLISNVTWKMSMPDYANITGTCQSPLTCSLYLNKNLVSNPFINYFPKGSYSFIYNTSGNENYTTLSLLRILKVAIISDKYGYDNDKIPHLIVDTGYGYSKND